MNLAHSTAIAPPNNLTMDPNLPLPPYLEALPETDPQWASLNSSAYAYAYGPDPGDGELAAFQIVQFVQPVGLSLCSLMTLTQFSQ